MNMTTNSFIGALQSGGPASDRADKMTLYGWLIGQWTMDAVVHRNDGSQHTRPGEIHFGWVLEETVRWSFTEITPDSFRWTGKRSRDDGKTWQLQADFRARRKS
jgi:hypothetical protein